MLKTTAMELALVLTHICQSKSNLMLIAIYILVVPPNSNSASSSRPESVQQYAPALPMEGLVMMIIRTTAVDMIVHVLMHLKVVARLSLNALSLE